MAMLRLDRAMESKVSACWDATVAEEGRDPRSMSCDERKKGMARMLPVTEG